MWDDISSIWFIIFVWSFVCYPVFPYYFLIISLIIFILSHASLYSDILSIFDYVHDLRFFINRIKNYYKNKFLLYCVIQIYYNKINKFFLKIIHCYVMLCQHWNVNIEMSNIEMSKVLFTAESLIWYAALQKGCREGALYISPDNNNVICWFMIGKGNTIFEFKFKGTWGITKIDLFEINFQRKYHTNF